MNHGEFFAACIIRLKLRLQQNYSCLCVALAHIHRFSKFESDILVSLIKVFVFVVFQNLRDSESTDRF